MRLNLRRIKEELQHGNQNPQGSAGAQGDHILRPVRPAACIVAAAPVAVTGFFQYNGLTFEQFAWAWLKSQILCAGPRTFQSENIYCKALTRKGVHDYD